MLNLCDILEVVGVDSAKVMSALRNGNFADLEDCLQSECAMEVEADYIVTRNIKDFKNSAVKAILLRDFLKRISAL